MVEKISCSSLEDNISFDNIVSERKMPLTTAITKILLKILVSF